MSAPDSIPLVTINFTSTRRNLTGEKFGRLTVTGLVGRGKRQVLLWRCVCTCGNIRVVCSSNLNKGHHQSCGCLSAELSSARLLKHGLSRTPEYAIWFAMTSRCHNPMNPRYADYGGRGITVCDQWRQSFETFYRDMGSRPSAKHEIDRKNNDNGYEPSNCHWTTRSENRRNTRRNRLLTFAGETLSVAGWAERMGIRPQTLANRLRRGWPVERSLTTERLQTWSRRPSMAPTVGMGRGAA